MPRKKEETAEKPEGRASQVLAGETIAKMRKKWGSNIVTLASDEKVRERHLIPSGILGLDWALGGGWLAGRIHTIYGLKSSAKTTLVTLAMAQAQKLCAICFTPKGESGACKCENFRDHVCAYIDVEGTWDDSWARRLGVNTETLMYSRPEYAEQSLDIMETLLRSGDVDLLALDSVAFLTPSKEIEESVDKETMGVQARLMGKGTRKLVSALTNAKNERGQFPTIFFTNQIRMKIGVMFGNPETQPGGLAHQFAATSEVRTRAGEYKIDDVTGAPLYADMHYKVDKNKADRPKMEGDFRLMLSDTETKKKGEIYDEDLMVKLAEKFGLLSGHGNSWTCFGEKFNGKSLVERRLLTDPPYKAMFHDSLMKVLLAV